METGTVPEFKRNTHTIFPVMRNGPQIAVIILEKDRCEYRKTVGSCVKVGQKGVPDLKKRLRRKCNVFVPLLARISHHAVSGIGFGGFGSGYWSVGSVLQWKTVGFTE